MKIVLFLFLFISEALAAPEIIFTVGSCPENNCTAYSGNYKVYSTGANSHSLAAMELNLRNSFSILTIRNGTFTNSSFFNGTNKPFIADSKLTAVDPSGTWADNEFIINGAVYVSSSEALLDVAPTSLELVNLSDPNSRITIDFTTTTPGIDILNGDDITLNKINYTPTGGVFAFSILGNLDKNTLTNNDRVGTYTGTYTMTLSSI